MPGASEASSPEPGDGERDRAPRVPPSAQLFSGGTSDSGPVVDAPLEPRTPVAAGAEQDEPVVFGFRYCDDDASSPWRFHPTQDTAATLFRLLAAAGRAKWHEVMTSGSHQPSSVPLGRLVERAELSPDAQQRLWEMGREETELAVLSLEAGPRLWGVLEGSVLQIVWLEVEGGVESA